MSRAAIKGAPFNPRTIDPYAKKKLQSNLKRVGLLETLVVNRVTGHLVSGHQRLACLDALEGHGGYLLDVAVVELSEKEEREQCVFLNNPAAQGSWDVLALGALLKQEGLDIEATGFDKLDLEVLFDETEYASFFAPDKAPAAVQKAVDEVMSAAGAGEAARKAQAAAKAASVAVTAPVPPPEAEVTGHDKEGAQASAEESTAANDEEASIAPSADADLARIEALKKRRQAFKDDYNQKLDTQFYLIVVCGDRDEAERLTKALGLPPGTEYIDGRRLADKIGVDLSAS